MIVSNPHTDYSNGIICMFMHVHNNYLFINTTVYHKSPASKWHVLKQTHVSFITTIHVSIEICENDET